MESSSVYNCISRLCRNGKGFHFSCCSNVQQDSNVGTYLSNEHTSGHKCCVTMVENALSPLYPAEIFNFIAYKQDTCCIPDNQVVMFVVFKKEPTITLYSCPRSSGKKKKSAGSLNTLFLSRIFY